MASKTFTARGVESETRLGYHADPDYRGLYLQISQGVTGLTKSWIFRYSSPLNGKRREMGLGPLYKQPLAAARKRARELWQQVSEGADPIEDERKRLLEARLAQGKLITFDQAADLCIRAKRPEWRNAKHAAQWTSSLRRYASPIIGDVPVQQIDTAMILRVLEPIWLSKTETATRIRQRIETILDFCKARGQLHGENVARLEGHLSELLPKAGKIQKVRHHAALPFTKINPFIKTLRNQGGTAAYALEFLILTAARTGSVVNAQWRQIDFANKVWEIPAEYMKAGKPFRIPLCDRAVEILRTLHKKSSGDYVFPAWTHKKKTGMSTGAMLALMKNMPQYSEYTPHGFRSTFRDWCAECTNYSNEVVEMALAHTIQNRVEAAYRRGDLFEKRIQLMNDWGKFVEAPANEKTSNNSHY